MDFDRLMNDFAREAGGTIEPDQDGVYALYVDDLPVSVGVIRETGVPVFWAEAGETPPDGKEAFYRMLLEASYDEAEAAGVRLSLERGTGRVFLRREESAAPEDLAELTERLNAFADALVEWRRRIADFRAGTDGGEDRDERESADFIRV